MFSNFILRYIWILGLFAISKEGDWFYDFELMSFILAFAEGFRRAQWSLLRVENEMNNNLEQYRTIPIIPPMVED